MLIDFSLRTLKMLFHCLICLVSNMNFLHLVFVPLFVCIFPGLCCLLRFCPLFVACTALNVTHLSTCLKECCGRGGGKHLTARVSGRLLWSVLNKTGHSIYRLVAGVTACARSTQDQASQHSNMDGGERNHNAPISNWGDCGRCRVLG